MSNNFRQTEQKPNSEPQPIDITSSPAIGNTHVVCSQSPELIFARKLYLCVQLLGGRSDILATIGSWRKEASDEQTFELLDCWIDATIKEQKSYLEYVIEWHNK